MKLVECVPNFSEGRRPDVVRAIRDAVAAVEGVTILDVSSDESHNRSVITFVAPISRAVDAAFAGIREARERIDLTKHKGEHPRIGATDVVPFVPLEGTTMEECIALARELGERVGKELQIPVYLYERAATRPTRQNLADVRRGEFEALLTEIGTVPEREPDFGPNKCHPTGGAVAIGARPFLVAYNIYLGKAENLPIAKQVAKKIRASSGGLPFVKALGMEVDGQAQVSINLVDTTETAMHRVFEAVTQEANANSVDVTWSEIVGLVPEQALFDTAAHYLKLREFTPEQVLEKKVRDEASGGDQSVSEFLAAIASSKPVPGGGSVAAHTGALGAALVHMVAGLTVGKKKYAAVENEMKEVAAKALELTARLSSLVKRDADAFSAVSLAYKLPNEKPEDTARRKQKIEQSLLGAATVPLETARACLEVAKLAFTCAERGNANALSDSGVAALLAQAGARGAAYNVMINISGLDDKDAATSLRSSIESLMDECDAVCDAVKSIVVQGIS